MKSGGSRLWRVMNIKKLIKKHKELISYVFFGGLTTLINWGTYFVLVRILGGAQSAQAVLFATAISQIIAITFAYITNRIFVFKSRQKGFKNIVIEMSKFFFFRGASFLLDLALMYIGVVLLFVNDSIMKLISNIIIVLVNYIFSKLFIFNKRNEEEK